MYNKNDLMWHEQIHVFDLIVLTITMKKQMKCLHNFLHPSYTQRSFQT